MLTPDDLRGDWTLDRDILDRRAGQAGRFVGTVRIDGDRLLTWREEGLLTLGDGQPLAASRDYLWRLDAAGFDVLFPDGRLLHRATWDGAATPHPCGADLYRAAYDFADWPDWSCTWDVTGPRKDYRLVSRLRRTGACATDMPTGAAPAAPGTEGGRHV